jgi:hypothetical protein
MASCISWSDHTASAPVQGLMGTSPPGLTVVRNPVRRKTSRTESVSQGKLAGRFGWAHVSTVMSAASPCAQSNSKLTRRKKRDLKRKVRFRLGPPPPENVTFALRSPPAPPPVTLILTAVYGKESRAPSLYQIVPFQVLAPAAVRLAIQWIRVASDPWIVPLAAICG